MKQCLLLRYEYSDQGTFGMFVSPKFTCNTLELPWRNNQPNISCIPKGDYICKLRKSPTFGLTYILTDPETGSHILEGGRSYILIHVGNVAGDVSNGYKTDSAGCILVGKHRGEIWNQKGVLSSRPTLRNLINSLNKEPFKLKIIGDV